MQRPAPKLGDSEGEGEGEDTSDIAALNRRLESDGTLPPAVWSLWLWGSEMDEPFSPEILLNRNQLLGVMVCRFKHRHSRSGQGQAGYGRFALMDKEVPSMTWRELKDTLANVQIEWPAFLQRLDKNRRADANLLSVKALIDACAERFGCLCERVWDETVLDDPSDTQPPDKGAEGRVLTASALRRITGTLAVLYRHLHLLAVCRPPRQGLGPPPDIRAHHYEASMADFYLWYMHFQLPAAAKINYQHDFPGMYNHVTQPVYFHNPGFERLPRRPLGDPDTPAIHALPSLSQLHPELPLRFEEDNFDPTRDAGWYWLVVSGRVYLVGAGPRVYYSPDACAMLAEYLAARDVTTTPEPPGCAGLADRIRSCTRP